jgi:hypothetical protein
MSNLPVDRDQNYMYQMWGTTSLITDYSKNTNQKEIREVVGDSETPTKHNFEKQNKIHSKIRNDDDYDDWEYGTEPLYG